MACIEHLVDVAEATDDFRDAINDRARHFRVGLKLVSARFVPLTSEHLHTEVVQPTLLLLAAPQFKPIDDLYRKAFDRALSNDASGAITAATSAVEEMLRFRLGVTGSQLEPLAQKARSQRIISPAVYKFATDLGAFRPDSDAHATGTDQFTVAMLAVQIAGAILLHLGQASEKA